MSKKGDANMVVKAVKPNTKIGPQNQGHKMSLRAFEFADVEKGYGYELARGYVIVSGVRHRSRAMQVEVIRDEIRMHERSHPGSFQAVLGRMECKLVMPEWESERHPDLAIYFGLPPDRTTRTMWRTWIPGVVVEIAVSSSVYVGKREEYWTLGAKEYWIVDAAMGKITQLRRGKSDWIAKELLAGDFVETKLLPGFKMPCQAVFDVAEESNDEE